MSKSKRSEEEKTTIKWTIGIIVFDIVIFAAIILATIYAHEIFPNLSVDKVGGMGTAIAILLIVPTIIGREVIIETFSKYHREENKKMKVEFNERDEADRKISDETRHRLNLPDEILTSYEFYTQHPQEDLPTKGRWVFCLACEIICIVMTVGNAFYGDLIPGFAMLIIIFMGLAIGIYGFCVLCGAYLKGIYYSVGPVLCFALPLLVAHLVGARKSWQLTVTAIVGGGVLFAAFLMMELVLPIRKRNKLTAEYYEEFYRADGGIQNIRLYFDDGMPRGLYAVKDGKKYAQILQRHSDNLFYVLVYDTIIYELTLQDMLIEEIKFIATQGEAEAIALRSLK